MSLQAALHFINAVRREERLRAQVESLPYGATLDEVVILAAAAGYEFNSDELRRAMGNDYRMRLLRYTPLPKS